MLFPLFPPQREVGSCGFLSTHSAGPGEGLWCYGNSYPTLSSFSHWYQAIRPCWVPLTLQEKLDRTQSFDYLPEKLGHWIYTPFLFLSRRKLEFSLCDGLGGRDSGAMVTTSPHHCHCASLAPSGCIMPSAISILKQATQNLAGNFLLMHDIVQE